VGDRAVPAHDGRGGRDGRVRDGGGGAFYALRGEHLDHARRFLSLGVAAGFLSAVIVAFPTGDHQAKLVARYQPAALAAMEGRFESGPYAVITIIGQPNVREHRIDNPLQVPGMLSFLAFGAFHRNVPGLSEFPPDRWPDNIELLYYVFHIMVGLGTLFIALMAIAGALLWRGALLRMRPVLWALMLAFPFPYIANAAGWLTCRAGPPAVGDLRHPAHARGDEPARHPGSALFTLIGFCGLYLVLGLCSCSWSCARCCTGRARTRTCRSRASRRRPRVPELWFGLVTLMLVLYVVLDGYDLGAGAIHLGLARTDAERRTVIEAIGPYWDANEVWLIAAGGSLLVAFPRVMSAALSGFYFAIFFVVWCLILRAIAIELRSHLRDTLWRGFWDVVFAGSSALLALLLGVAFGNVIRGVPLTAEGWFGMTLFTTFRPRDPGGILDYYTLLAGVVSVVALSAHGAAYLAWRTTGALQERARLLALVGQWALVALWPVATWATYIVNPAMLQAVPGRPFAWLMTLLAAAGPRRRAAPRRPPTAARRRSSARPHSSPASSPRPRVAVPGDAARDPRRVTLDPRDGRRQHAGRHAHRARLVGGGFPLVIAWFAILFRIHRGKATVAPEG
jgi:cytochrome bd-type quinol oxidase subunit 2